MFGEYINLYVLVAVVLILSGGAIASLLITVGEKPERR
jgi:hypothetical protein